MNFKRKGCLVTRKKKYIIKKKYMKFLKNKKIDKNFLTSFLKYVEAENLNIDVSVGTLFLFPTLFAVPTISTILEYIKLIPFEKLKQYNYVVTPVYDKLKLKIEVNALVKMRIIDLIKYGIKTVYNFRKQQ